MDLEQEDEVGAQEVELVEAKRIQEQPVFRSCFFASFFVLESTREELFQFA